MVRNEVLEPHFERMCRYLTNIECIHVSYATYQLLEMSVLGALPYSETVIWEVEQC